MSSYFINQDFALSLKNFDAEKLHHKSVGGIVPNILYVVLQKTSALS